MEQNNSADLLLVIDMQNVYTKGQEWACEGVEAASASILRLLNSRMPEQVIFTRYLAAEHPEGVWKEYNEMNAAINADAWLNEMIAKFDWITFRYEYSHKLLAYCIEVLPANSIERSEEYANEEYNFSCDFEQKFNESVIFSNGTEFYRCSENAVVIGQVRQKNIEWIKDDSFILDLEDYILDFKDDNFKKIESGIFATCKKWDNYNFDLAA